MHRLLFNGIITKYKSLEEALQICENLSGEWSLLDPDGELIADHIGIVEYRKGQKKC